MPKRQWEPDVHHLRQADDLGASPEPLDRAGLGHGGMLPSPLPGLKPSYPNATRVGHRPRFASCENASPKAGVHSFESRADQKQHSSMAAQQAIRSPQQSDAAKAAVPKAKQAAAAARVVFIVISPQIRLFDRPDQAVARGGGTTGSIGTLPSLFPGERSKRATSALEDAAIPMSGPSRVPHASTHVGASA